MHKVVVSARSIPMPSICACCGGPPSTNVAATASRTKGKRVKHTEERAFEFPACAQCVAHIKAMPNASSFWSWALVPTVLALVAAAPLGVLLAVTWCPALFALYRFELGRARSKRSPTCECEHSLVMYEGWYGSDHTFVMESRRFGEALVATCERAGKTAVASYSSSTPAVAASTGRGNWTMIALLVIIVFAAVCMVAASEDRRRQEAAQRGVVGASAAPTNAPIPTSFSVQNVDAGVRHRPARRPRR